MSGKDSEWIFRSPELLKNWNNKLGTEKLPKFQDVPPSTWFCHMHTDQNVRHLHSFILFFPPSLFDIHPTPLERVSENFRKRFLKGIIACDLLRSEWMTTLGTFFNHLLLFKSLTGVFSKYNLVIAGSQLKFGGHNSFNRADPSAMYNLRAVIVCGESPYWGCYYIAAWNLRSQPPAIASHASLLFQLEEWSAEGKLKSRNVNAS